MKETFTTNIIAKEIKVVYTGTNKTTGAEYKIRQVIATKPDGTAIDLNLRTFEEGFPLNEVIEVDATLFNSPQYGISYTLTRKKQGGGGSGGLGKKVDDLRARLDTVEAYLDRFAGTWPQFRNDWRDGLAAQQQQAAPQQQQAAPPPAPVPQAAPPPPPVQQPPAQAPTAGQQFGDDPPF